jgi:hypothetical protein
MLKEDGVAEQAGRQGCLQGRQTEKIGRSKLTTRGGMNTCNFS